MAMNIKKLVNYNLNKLLLI